MKEPGATGAAKLIGSAEAYAKINLRHVVFARDETGYHGVETLLARTSLSDTVALFERGSERDEPRVTLSVDGPLADAVPAGADNLCHRAAELFFREAFREGSAPVPLHIRLTKRIPPGSGLGGGSADAAATLRLLAVRWPGFDERKLVALAGSVGSDVVFLLTGVPMALGWERGRRLLPLRPPRPRPGLLLCPPVAILSAEAYQWLSEKGADVRSGGASVLPGTTRLADWESLERLVRNDFEAPVAARHPEIAEALERLRSEASAALAGITGSGSALFSIFGASASRAQAREIMAGAVEPDGWRIYDVSLPV